MTAPRLTVRHACSSSIPGVRSSSRGTLASGRTRAVMAGPSRPEARRAGLSPMRGGLAARVGGRRRRAGADMTDSGLRRRRAVSRRRSPAPGCAMRGRRQAAGQRHSPGPSASCARDQAPNVAATPGGVPRRRSWSQAPSRRLGRCPRRYGGGRVPAQIRCATRRGELRIRRRLLSGPVLVRPAS